MTAGPYVDLPFADFDEPAATVRGDARVAREVSGAAVLDAVEAFLNRFVVYPSEHERVAHVLWIAHTWLIDAWESTPRIAFLSPEPGSGKSRALEVTEPLVPRPVHAVNTTPAYLFRKVSDPAGAPTILYDEIDTVFGPKAKDNEDVRGMLNAGHRKGAMAGRCVVRGKIVETEELPAYCAVALAGLDDLPDTLMSRSIVVRMRRRAPTEHVEPWRLRVNGPEADSLSVRLAAWCASVEANAVDAWPAMPAGVEDRAADVWEAPLAVADLAGGEWPDRARRSAVALVAATAGRAPSIGVLLLGDLRGIFDTDDKLSTDDLLAALHELEESPWADLRGKPLDARGLSRRLAKYDVKPKNLRIDGRVVKGYTATDLADAWTRYLPPAAAPVTHSSKRSEEVQADRSPPPPENPATAATAVTPQVRKPQAVAGTDTCTECGEPLNNPGALTRCKPNHQGADMTNHRHRRVVELRRNTAPAAPMELASPPRTHGALTSSSSSSTSADVVGGAR